MKISSYTKKSLFILNKFTIPSSLCKSQVRKKGGNDLNTKKGNCFSDSPPKKYKNPINCNWQSFLICFY